MLADIIYPIVLEPKLLDRYLENGWFRLSQGVFTTNFLKFNDIIYSSLWLRIGLENFEPSKTQQKLLKQNAHFRVQIQPTAISTEQENLFQAYKSTLPFDTYNSLQKLLFGEVQSSVFRDYEVNIYDGDRLIATGFFDLGEKSAEGISCFFHPEYKKYSLGKYLMLQKILFSKKNGLDYFYPGYFAPGYRLFDYKLDLGKTTTTYFDVLLNKWRPISEFDSENTPIKIIERKLAQLSTLLKAIGIPHKVQYYDYFDVNMVTNFIGQGLLDVPMFIECDGHFQHELGIFIFDILSNQFQFVLCEYKYQLNFPKEIENHFTNYLLKSSTILCQNESITEILEQFLKLF